VAVRHGGRSNLGLWIFHLTGLRGPKSHRITPYSVAWCVAFTMGFRRRHIFLANVPRQVSLAGGVGGSHGKVVKALGMLFCQHPLCLNAKPRTASLERPHGQRLAGRACSHIFFRGPMGRGMSLALVLISARSIPASSFWNIHFSGGAWQARGRGNRKSFHAAPLEYICCGMMLCGPSQRSQ